MEPVLPRTCHSCHCIRLIIPAPSGSFSLFPANCRTVCFHWSRIMKNALLPGHCPASSTCRPAGDKDAHQVKQITFPCPSATSGLKQNEVGQLKNGWGGAQDGSWWGLQTWGCWTLVALGIPPASFGVPKCQPMVGPLLLSPRTVREQHHPFLSWRWALNRARLTKSHKVPKHRGYWYLQQQSRPEDLRLGMKSWLLKSYQILGVETEIFLN